MIDEDPVIQSLLKAKKSKFKQADDYAVRLGEILGEAIKKNVSGDILPNEKMYYNIADRVLGNLLSKSHQQVTDFTAGIQELLNKEAKVPKVKTASFNEKMADGLIQKVADADKYDDVAPQLYRSLTTFNMNVVAENIKTNAEYQRKLGFSPKIKRTSFNGCDWCQEKAGEYTYPNVKPDIYKRHEGCRCTLEFVSSEGKKKVLWDKNTESAKQRKKRREEARAKTENNKKVKMKSKQERKKTAKDKQTESKRVEQNKRLENKAVDLAIREGCDRPPSSKDVVKVLEPETKRWVSKIEDTEKHSINKYSFNSEDEVKGTKKIYKRINGYYGGYYYPLNKKEEDTIIRNGEEIHSGIVRYNLKHDILVYRTDDRPDTLNGTVGKFISTSVTPDSSFRGRPNVAIIVPKGTPGAYIAPIVSPKFKRQKEFLLDMGTTLEKIYDSNGHQIFIVRG